MSLVYNDMLVFFFCLLIIYLKSGFEYVVEYLG